MVVSSIVLNREDEIYEFGIDQKMVANWRKLKFAKKSKSNNQPKNKHQRIKRALEDKRCVKSVPIIQLEVVATDRN